MVVVVLVVVVRNVVVLCKRYKVFWCDDLCERSTVCDDDAESEKGGKILDYICVGYSQRGV